MLAEGIFYSKLRYGLPLITTTWGLNKFKDGDDRFKNFTKEDNRKLQVLQNQLCRIILMKRNLYQKQSTSTEQLLKKCKQLSVHQIGAYMTLVMIKKILLSGRPGYIRRRLQVQDNSKTRRSETLLPIRSNLSFTRSSFIYRGIKLFNMLPRELQDEANIKTFEQNVKEWVSSSIVVKP